MDCLTDSLDRLLICAGLRAVSPHGHPGTPPRRVGDWTGLHLHHAQATASSHQTGGKEPHPGTLPSFSRRDEL